MFLRLKIWHAIGQFEREIGSPSAAPAVTGVVARSEVMDTHPLSYLVRVSEEGPPTYLALLGPSGDGRGCRETS